MHAVLERIGAEYQLANAEMRRLFHGRGGCFEGFGWLVVDFLPPVAIIRVYNDKAPVSLEPLVDYLMALDGVTGVGLQYRGRSRHPETSVLAGEVAPELVCNEAGLSYAIRPLANQNPGLFLDMRSGRAWVRAHSADKRVLNLFSYTCGFSVAAMAGGASSVVNLDMSAGALKTGRRNHRLNLLSEDKVRYLSHDLMRSWGKLKKLGPYDLVIIDPPSFQPGSFVAQKDYRRVLRRLPDLVDAGGYVLACHNDPEQREEFLRGIMAEEAPGFQFKERLAQGEDFPEQDSEQGVKVLLYKREGAWN
ncbi:class I SAM-dependent methyltransferase [Marinobacterium litorale]|uniref:class I SAM-dependent methyltransferase n=1 Tax=Marinobacterium litorale TaxID=404770 RepID=UPI0003F76401|nr:class I SAM-dependent methyltransferase [Marinobacterium litorale]